MVAITNICLLTKVRSLNNFNCFLVSFEKYVVSRKKTDSHLAQNNTIRLHYKYKLALYFNISYLMSETTMDDAELYNKYHRIQAEEATFVLENDIKSIKWKSGDSILDVGTATGEVTAQVLAPLLPHDFEKLVGLDISPEMINLAKEQNKNPKIDFIVCDIASENITKTIDEKFDHIFSFFCLNWVQNQKQTVKNMYNLLKPGGDMLLAISTKSTIFDIYESMASYPKWSKFLTNTEEYISPYNHCTDPETVYKNMLLDEGFEVKHCRVLQRFMIFSDLSELRNTLLAVNPFVNKLPEDLQSTYVEDYMKELYNFNYFQRLESGEIVLKIPHRICTVLAFKP
ncbi:PREDICTED: juvenile hormone acid O-methyltransferase-like [Nicrophorus vespilloides]|uniref:Juvenile hormone acid O-methyltransferase-like n=1 Tax=Nicrophorus vespilloides TaxID=110193 RepID=A0ABM1N0B1_NICVS|nr:PREDICTED: juvenile hormone acid O-methyltransferase-like [Nicrophorus vespilloides]